MTHRILFRSPTTADRRGQRSFYDHPHVGNHWYDLEQGGTYEHCLKELTDLRGDRGLKPIGPDHYQTPWWEYRVVEHHA